jgi:hypothetical protein
MVDIIQRQYDLPAQATAAVAAGAANISEVTITVRNANGKPITAPYSMDLWLSDSAVGTGYSASTTSGAVTVKTAGTTGTLIGTYLAKFGLRVQTLANGTFVLSITDTNKVAFKVCVQVEGVTYVVATLATASYG